jgi:AraC-like DNA-binding protein
VYARLDSLELFDRVVSSMRSLEPLCPHVPMPAVTTSTFTDSTSYAAAFPDGVVNLVFDRDRDFRARLTLAELPRLHITHCEENLRRVAYLALTEKRAVLSLNMRRTTPLFYKGTELGSDEIIFHCLGDQFHQRTDGASEWAYLSLTPALLSAYSRTLRGADLAPPAIGTIQKLSSPATARLRSLLAKLRRLIQATPHILAHNEVARSVEHDILQTLIPALGVSVLQDHRGALQRHASAVLSLELELAANPMRKFRTSDFCASIQIRERALQRCCSKILGMGPRRYERLRRLNCVRAALQTAGRSTRIGEVASSFGFRELGRFAAEYRKVFGECPSATLSRRSFW